MILFALTSQLLIIAATITEFTSSTPVTREAPLYGCAYFPCDGSYTLPGDIPTQHTPEIDMAITIGYDLWGEL
jgi:hypothetical protein